MCDCSGWLAERIRVPYPIVLVLAGIGVGLAYGGLGLELDPEVVLAVVLPAVLYPAAVNTSWRDFRALLRPILLLAIGLVATTTLAVGVAFKWLVPEVPWAVAFALGAVVSPPDAVAATAVLRRFRLSRWLVTLLEGESLVNDATGLVLFPLRRRRSAHGRVLGLADGRRLRPDRGRRDRDRRWRGLALSDAAGATPRSDARAVGVADDAVRDLLALRGVRSLGRPRRGRRGPVPLALVAPRHLAARAAQCADLLGCRRSTSSTASCSC
jgi:hypothetical protein